MSAIPALKSTSQQDSDLVRVARRLGEQFSARGAQMAYRAMVATAMENTPGAESVNEVMIGRTLVARHAIAAVELAMEAAGEAAFYLAAGLERRFRDIQGARYHLLQNGPQAAYAGSMALACPSTGCSEAAGGKQNELHGGMGMGSERLRALCPLLPITKRDFVFIRSHT